MLNLRPIKLKDYRFKFPLIQQLGMLEIFTGLVDFTSTINWAYRPNTKELISFYESNDIYTEIK